MAANHRVKNLYYMLSYAFTALRQGEFANIATEDFENIHNLLAEIICRGVSIQVKRGLHRDYLAVQELLTSPKGQLRLSESIKRLTMVQGRLVCDYDEFLVDSPHNQALKSVMNLLVSHGDISASRRQDLRRLLAYFDEVTVVAPSGIRWEALRYHRNNAPYRALLGVCRLVVEGLLMTTASGERRLQSWLNDERMFQLYERFIRAYFQRHHAEYEPKAGWVRWDITTGVPSSFVPTMKTDLTLHFADRTLIIDMKWYGHVFQTDHWSGEQRYRESHLYQIYTYVKNADPAHTGKVSGILLYAKTDEPTSPDEDLVIGGNPIGVKTLDLDADWSGIVAQLEGLCHWLDEDGARSAVCGPTL